VESAYGTSGYAPHIFCSEEALTAVASVWQLLTIRRQINSGWPLVLLLLHCDTSFNVCSADLSFITIGCNELGGYHHHIVSGLILAWHAVRKLSKATKPQMMHVGPPFFLCVGCLHVMMLIARLATWPKQLSIIPQCNCICLQTPVIGFLTCIALNRLKGSLLLGTQKLYQGQSSAKHWQRQQAVRMLSVAILVGILCCHQILFLLVLTHWQARPLTESHCQGRHTARVKFKYSQPECCSTGDSLGP
jgi:hypothetical protein